MLIRAGESDRGMVECLGIDINRLYTIYTIVFAAGVKKDIPDQSFNGRYRCKILPKVPSSRISTKVCW
jgi:hypothetical protein